MAFNFQFEKKSDESETKDENVTQTFTKMDLNRVQTDPRVATSQFTTQQYGNTQFSRSNPSILLHNQSRQKGGLFVTGNPTVNTDANTLLPTNASISPQPQIAIPNGVTANNVNNANDTNDTNANANINANANANINASIVDLTSSNAVSDAANGTIEVKSPIDSKRWEIPPHSKDRFVREFKSVSEVAFRFQFICEAYRRCKNGKVFESDFPTLEKLLTNVYKLAYRNAHPNNPNAVHATAAATSPHSPNSSNTINSNATDASNGSKSSHKSALPSLNRIQSPKCMKCGVAFPPNQCFTTCNHPICIHCLHHIFSAAPGLTKIPWYACQCGQLLPPPAHFLALSYRPVDKELIQFYERPASSHSSSHSNHGSTQQQSKPNSNSSDSKESDASSSNSSDAGNGSASSSPVKDEKTKRIEAARVNYRRIRNICYKNMLKVLGEFLNNRLKNYERWRRCENDSCNFGFLADPDVNWSQIFELKCVVCGTIQRVQLICPFAPCPKICLRKHFIPNPSLETSAVQKTLIFVRHGQACNNVNPSDPNLRDPPLTDKGRQQCQQVFQTFGQFISVECVLVSTLTRTLETSQLCFANKTSSVPFIAMDELRERMAPHFNRRLNISVKKEKYTNVDWSLCEFENDDLFDRIRKNESYEAMNERAWLFYRHLLSRKERCIAVVSHEGILSCLLNIIDSSKELRKPFRNCETRITFLNKRK